MSNVSVTFRNLTARAKTTRPVVGREQELRKLVQILLKPHNHHAAIVGKPGVGKTSLVAMLAQAVRDKALPGLPAKMYELDISPVLNLLQSGDSVQSCYQAIRHSLERLPSGAIVVVEDIQLLAGDTALRREQTVGLLQMIADITKIRLVITTTTAAYSQVFQHDYLFGRLFTTLELAPLPAATITSILHQAFTTHGVAAAPGAVAAVATFARQYGGGRELPDAGIRLVEDIAMQAVFDGKSEVSADAVKAFVAERYKVPIAGLEGKDNTHLASLEERLNQRVIGQPAALKVISRSIIKNELGLRDESRPRGSFLLLGPSGVGKTETAKALTDIVFSNPSALVRLDMSEYSEPHTAVRLIGSPPGYVGYEEGGQLTGALQRQPHSLVLLDEIEKAHPKLFDIFLQLLDDGRLTDAHANTIDCTHTMVLATSNIGSQVIADAAARGVDVSSPEFIQKTLLPLLMQHFRPEFINRFDAILVYEPLAVGQLVALAERELYKLEAQLSARQITFAIPTSVITRMLEAGYNPLFGARPVRRLIAQHFEMPIAERIVSGQLANGTTITGTEPWLKS